MKNSLVLVLSFLLLSLCSNPLMADDFEPLYDTSGDKVVTGTRYYLVAASSEDGGGLSTSVPVCPGDIYLESSASSLGQPIIFLPANYTGIKGTVIYESSDLNMHFNTQLCLLLPNEWNIHSYDNSVGAWTIWVRGLIHKNGPCWFKFVKVSSENVYAILFDPSGCEYNEIIPKSYVGIISESNRGLALINYPPLLLKIVKVSDAHQVKEARLNKAMIASVV